jgi:hypothetical protein
MAQPANITVNVTLDVSGARRKVRALSGVCRDVLVELARLEEALAQIEGREAALAHYGIQLLEAS